MEAGLRASWFELNVTTCRDTPGISLIAATGGSSCPSLGERQSEMGAMAIRGKEALQPVHPELYRHIQLHGCRPAKCGTWLSAVKQRGRTYKKEFGDFPTVDYIGHGLGSPRFVVCS
jgi:hypothetical protein